VASTSPYPHISTDIPARASVGDTRYKVIQLAAEHYHYGWSAEELLRQHPDLRPEEVYASLAYFYDHFEEMVSTMQAINDDIQSRRNTQSWSRDELMRRTDK
jgi:uncharacterized protein (DUF433 family)